MPNVPAQFPNIDLPGAEFFSLAPNATVALQGRRRFQGSVTVAVPAASAAQALIPTQTLETGFPAGAGIYLHDFWVQVFPQDISQELQVNSSFAVLTTSANLNGYPLGLPLLTQLTPAGGQVALREQQKLFAARDINAFSFPPSLTLSLSVTFFFKNLDATNPHSISIVSGIVYTRLDGLQE